MRLVERKDTMTRTRFRSLKLNTMAAIRMMSASRTYRLGNLGTAWPRTNGVILVTKKAPDHGSGAQVRTFGEGKEVR